MRNVVGMSSLAGLVALLAGSLLAPVSTSGAAAGPEEASVTISPMVVSRFELGPPRGGRGSPFVAWVVRRSRPYDRHTIDNDLVLGGAATCRGTLA